MKAKYSGNLLAALVFGMGGVLYQPTAQAGCCVYGPDIVNNHTTREVTGAIREINKKTETVVSEATKAIIENFVKETRKQRNAIATTVMYNAKTVRDTLVGLEQSKIRRDMEEPPGSCVTSEMPLNLLNSAKSAESYSRQEAAVITQNILSDSKAGEEVVFSNVATRSTHFKPRGDAYSLLMGASDNVSSTGNYTYSDEQLSDARSYVKDIFTGIRLPTGSDDSSKGKAIASQGRVGLVLSAFTDEVARRAAVPSLRGAVQGGGLEGFLKSDAGTVLLNSSGGLSYSGLLAADVDRRYLDPKWFADVASLSSSVSLNKEQLYLSATALKIQHEQLKALRKIEMQIAAQTLVHLTGGGGSSSGYSAGQLNQMFGGL